MDFLALIPLLPLIVVVTACAVIDVRTRRIPNAVTLPLAAAGVVSSMIFASPLSPTASLLGLAVGFALLLVPFAIGAMGGGDVKLLAAVGAWTGPAGVLAVFVVAAISAMCVAVAQGFFAGRLTELFRNSTVLAGGLLTGATRVSDLESDAAALRSIDKPLPYAVPILLGVLGWGLWRSVN